MAEELEQIQEENIEPTQEENTQGEQVDQTEQTTQEPPTKASKLYNNLLKDGYTKQNLGSESDFIKMATTKEGAAKLHANLLKDGYTESNLGDLNSFTTNLVPQPPVQKYPTLESFGIDNKNFYKPSPSDATYVAKKMTGEKIEQVEKYKKNLLEAIDNTTNRALTKKGIKAQPNSPVYNAQKKKIEDAIKNGDAVYSVDPVTKTPALSQTTGFVESFWNALKTATTEEDESDDFVNKMNTQERLKYVEDRLKKIQPTKEGYIGEVATGIRGKAGELLGGVAPFMTKATAGAMAGAGLIAAAPETMGASLAGIPTVLAFAATTPSAVNQGGRDEVVRRFDIIKKQNPNLPGIEIMKEAEKGLTNGEITGGLTNLLFMGLGAKPLAPEAKVTVGKFLEKTLASASHVGATVTGTKAGQEIVAGIEDKRLRETPKQIITNAVDNFTQNFTVGAALHTLTNLPQIPGAVKSSIKYALAKENPAELAAILKNNETIGNVPPGTTEKVMSDIEGYNEALNKTSQNLTPETQASVAGLIQKRDNLVSEMGTKDPTQVESYQEQIDALNEQIKKITNTNDPFSHETNELGQTLNGDIAEAPLQKGVEEVPVPKEKTENIQETRRNQFQSAGELARKEGSGNAIGNDLLQNSKIGDTIVDKNGDGYEVTEVNKRKDGTSEVILVPFELINGEKDYNYQGTRLISESNKKSASDLYEYSYTNSKGERVTETYTYNIGEPAKTEGKQQAEVPVPTEEIKTTQYDTENISGIPSEIGRGQEPIQTQPIEGGGTQATSGGGVLQENVPSRQGEVGKEAQGEIETQKAEIERIKNRILPNQQKRLEDAKEIAANGTDFDEAVDNLQKKSEDARNRANERLKKEAAKEGVKPIDIQERLDNYEETKEAERYDYLIKQINDYYTEGKSENFGTSSQFAIAVENNELEKVNKRLEKSNAKLKALEEKQKAELPVPSEKIQGGETIPTASINATTKALDGLSKENPDAHSKIEELAGVMYHGTEADFDKFEKVGSKIPALGLGYYFTPTLEKAKQYGSKIKKIVLEGAKILNWNKLTNIEREQIKKRLEERVPKSLLGGLGERKEKIFTKEQRQEASDFYKQKREETDNYEYERGKARVKRDGDKFIVSWSEEGLGNINDAELLNFAQRYDNDIANEMGYDAAKYGNEIAVYDNKKIINATNEFISKEYHKILKAPKQERTEQQNKFILSVNDALAKSELPKQKETPSEQIQPTGEKVSGTAQPVSEVPKEQEIKAGVQPSAEPISGRGAEATTPILEKTPEQITQEQLSETETLLSGEAEKRRQEGKFIKDGVEYKRNEKDGGERGNSGEVRFTNDVSLPFKYKIVEAETLQPSHQDGIRNPMHFIPEAQPKNRNDVGSLQAEESFANNPRFDELGENTNAYSGAPIVNERNEVVQGNNRSAGLRKGYKRGNQTYKESLVENADKFGFTKEQVQGIKNPILVREVAVSDAGAIELGNYDVKDLETGGKRRLDPVAITRRLPFNIKGRLSEIFKGDESINQAIRSNAKKVIDLLSPYLNQAQRNTITKEGELTEAGAKDLESVVQHLLFDGGDVALPDLFESLSHTQKEGLRKSLPYIFSTTPDKSIVPEIQEAIIALNHFNESNAGNFDNWLAQQDMFNNSRTPKDIYSPIAIEIAKRLTEAKNQKEISKVFGEYANEVNDKPATLLDEAKPGLSKKEGIKNIFKTEYDETKKPTTIERGGGKISGEQKVTEPEAIKQPEPKPAKPKEPTKPTTAKVEVPLAENPFEKVPKTQAARDKYFQSTFGENAAKAEEIYNKYKDTNDFEAMQKEMQGGKVAEQPPVPPIVEKPKEEMPSEEEKWTAIRKEKLEEIKGVKDMFEKQTSKSWTKIQQEALEGVAKEFPRKTLSDAIRTKVERLAAKYDAREDYNPTAKDLAVIQEFKRQTESRITAAKEDLLSDNDAERFAAISEMESYENDLMNASKALFVQEAGRAFGFRQSESIKDENAGLQIRRMQLMKANGMEKLSDADNKFLESQWEKEKELMKREQEIKEQALKEGFDKEIAKLQEEYEAKLKEKKVSATDKKASDKLRKFAEKIRNSKTLDSLGLGAPIEGETKGISFNTKEALAKVIDKMADGMDKIEAITKVLKEYGLDKSKEFSDLVDKALIKIAKPDTEETLSKIKDLAEKTGEKNVTNEMVTKGLIKDYVNSFIGEVDKSNILNEATAKLKEVLPDLNKRTLRSAFLKEGEFKQPTKKSLNEALNQAKRDLIKIEKEQSKKESTEDELQKKKLEQEKEKAQKSIKDYQRKLDNGEFEKEEPTVLKKQDAELIQINKEKNQIKSEFDKKRKQLEEKNKHWLQRAADFARSSYIAALIGSPKTLAKVAYMSVIRPVSEITRKVVLGNLFKAIAPSYYEAALRGGESASLKSIEAGLKSYFKQMGEKKMQEKFQKSSNEFDQAAKKYYEAVNAKADEKTLSKLKKDMDNKRLAAMGNIVYQFIGGSSIKDALQSFVNRANEIERQFGKTETESIFDGDKLDKLNYILGFIGRSHSAAKTFSGRFSYAASFMARLEGAARDGSISDPNRIIEIAHESYLDWERGKYQQDNWVTSTWNDVVNSVSNKKTKGEWSKYDKALTALLKTDVAITRVPVNILHEAVAEYTLGALRAPIIAYKEYNKAKGKAAEEGYSKTIDSKEFKTRVKELISQMDEKQAAKIYRLFTKGGLGAGLYGLALATGLVQFGVFPHKGQKKKKEEEYLKEGELNPGQIMFGKDRLGETASKMIEHSPSLWTTFMGLGIAKIYADDVKEGKMSAQAAWDAAYTHMQIIESSIPQSKVVSPLEISKQTGKAFAGKLSDYGMLDNYIDSKGAFINQEKKKLEMTTSEVARLKDYKVEPPRLGVRSQNKIEVDAKHPKVGLSKDGKPYAYMNDFEWDKFNQYRKDYINNALKEIYDAADGGDIKLTQENLTDALTRITKQATTIAKNKLIEEGLLPEKNKEDEEDANVESINSIIKDIYQEAKE